MVYLNFCALFWQCEWSRSRPCRPAGTAVGLEERGAASGLISCPRKELFHFHTLDFLIYPYIFVSNLKKKGQIPTLISREVKGDLLSLASVTQGVKCQKRNNLLFLNLGFFLC